MSNETEKKIPKKRKKTEYKLNDHRKSLMDNPNAYTEHLKEKSLTLIDILKGSGYHKMDRSKPESELLALDITMAIFNAQGCKPYFHIEGELPFCWNVTKEWGKNYIVYEWGHMNSKHNHDKKAKVLKNLCLQSQRCNQHIQSGLDIEDLKKYGGKIEEVIIKNQDSFEKLYNSQEWKLLEERLNNFKSRAIKKKTDGSKVAAELS